MCSNTHHLYSIQLIHLRQSNKSQTKPLHFTKHMHNVVNRSELAQIFLPTTDNSTAELIVEVKKVQTEQSEQTIENRLECFLVSM